MNHARHTFTYLAIAVVFVACNDIDSTCANVNALAASNPVVVVVVVLHTYIHTCATTTTTR